MKCVCNDAMLSRHKNHQMHQLSCPVSNNKILKIFYGSEFTNWFVYFAFLWKVVHSIANDNILELLVWQRMKSPPFLQSAKNRTSSHNAFITKRWESGLKNTIFSVWCIGHRLRVGKIQYMITNSVKHDNRLIERKSKGKTLQHCGLNIDLYYTIY